MSGLLGRLGFNGLIVTDGVEMPPRRRAVRRRPGAVRALAAGAGAICVGGERKGAGVVGFIRNAIMAAVIDGTLPEERLAEAASRVRRLAAWSAERRRATSAIAQTPESAAVSRPPGEPCGSVATGCRCPRPRR